MPKLKASDDTLTPEQLVPGVSFYSRKQIELFLENNRDGYQELRLVRTKGPFKIITRHASRLTVKVKFGGQVREAQTYPEPTGSGFCFFLKC